MIAIIVLMLGLVISAPLDSWIPFAVSVIAAFGAQWFKDEWLHDHIHHSIKEQEEEHGIQTID